MISVHYSNKNEAKNIDVSIIHDYNQKADFISMRSANAKINKMNYMKREAYGLSFFINYKAITVPLF